MIETQVILDNIFVLVSAVLVFLMQPGFALVEMGLTRASSAASIMLKNLMDMALGVLVFAVVGYNIAFSGSQFLGFKWAFSGYPGVTETGLSVPVQFLFQAAFAAAAATIVSGAMAERTRFVAYLIYTVTITGLIYPIVVNWLWGGGWLAELGFHDFAGSTIVHSVGGWAALAGAWTLGPRIGRFDADGNPRALAGASIPLAVVGAFLLFVGWFGFNAGSELAADMEVPRIAVTTLLAAGAGATMAMVISWHRLGHPDVAVAANGLLAGLVGITAGTFLVDPLGAVAIGLVAGAVVIAGEALLLRLRIDDPVGAVAVHAFCGVWGTVAVGLFASRGALVDPTLFDDLGLAGEGLLYGGGFGLLTVQVTGAVVVAVFVLGASTILFRSLKALGILRISEAEELQGQDYADLGLLSTNPPSELVAGLSSQRGSNPEEILARSVIEKVRV